MVLRVDIPLSYVLSVSLPILVSVLLAVFSISAAESAPTNEPLKKDEKAPKIEKGNKATAFRLTQYGEVIGGRTLTVAKDGLKIFSRKGGLTIVSRAPDWRVVLYNFKSRLYWEMPRSQFTGDSTARLYSNDQKDFRKAKWIKTGTQSKLGRTMDIYVMEPPPMGKRQGATSATYYVDSKAVIAKEAYDILGKVYFLPPVVGVPLRFKFRDLDDGAVNALETGTIETLTVSPDEFSCPSEYKKAKSMDEVMVDPASQATFDALKQFVNR